MRTPSLIACATLVGAPAATTAAQKGAALGEVAIVSAIDTVMVGQRVGFTVFQNVGWSAGQSDFEANAEVLRAIEPILNREVKLVDGKEVTLPPEKGDDGISVGPASSDLKRTLSELGRAWKVDTILLIQATRTSDWVGGTNQPIQGFGIYARAKGTAYCVLRKRVFNVAQSQFVEDTPVKHAQTLPGIRWRNHWTDFTPEEQRAMIRTLAAVFKDCAPMLLAKTGLTEAKVEGRSIGSMLLRPGAPPKSFLPKGNELEIPDGVSLAQARHAVVAGFKRRGWLVTEESEERIVGVHRDGKNEVTCIATFTSSRIVLAPEGHKIHADGRREQVTPFARWQENVKASILVELVRVPATETP